VADAVSDEVRAARTEYELTGRISAPRDPFAEIRECSSIMLRSLDLNRTNRLLALCLAAAVMTGCAGTGEGGTGGTSGEGGSPGTGGTATGGNHATGGNNATGGFPGTGGATGGTPGTGGIKATGGTGGGTGGGSGGAKGGASGNGGAKGGASGGGGTKATGGTPGTGGTPSDGGSVVDCNATLPSGGTMHTGSTQGMAGSLSSSIWMNGSGGSITTYSTPAFSASWGPNSGDFLARIGLSWGNSGKAVSALGTVKADFAETKTGSAGGYSYVGIYGWSVNPCVEWYIVDDSYNSLPFNPGGSMVGTVNLDGGMYNIIQRSTTGTGGNRCGNVTSWNQFYSVRTSKRSCGTISISDHFAAWAAKNLTLGSVLEASILIEAGGGTGSIQFQVANVTAQ